MYSSIAGNNYESDIAINEQSNRSLIYTSNPTNVTCIHSDLEQTSFDAFTHLYDHEVTINSNDAPTDLDRVPLSFSTDETDGCDDKLLACSTNNPMKSTSESSDLTTAADVNNSTKICKRRCRKRIKPQVLLKCQKGVSSMGNCKIKIKSRVRSKRVSHYNCQECEFVAPSRAKLAKHCTATHDVERLTQSDLQHCQECEFVASTQPKLIQHCATEHDIELTPRNYLHHCQECQFMTSNRPELVKHCMAEHDVELTTRNYLHHCQKCEFMASSRGELISHCTMEHNIELTTRNYLHHCQECEFMASSRAELVSHCNTDHNIELTKRNYLQHCHLCVFMASSRADLGTHCSIEHNIELTRRNRLHHCRECDFKATKKAELIEHCGTEHDIELTTRINLHKCQDCEFMASSIFDLREHGKEMHRSKQIRKRPHACHQCALVASSRRELTAHCASEHSSDKLMKKQYCRKCKFITLSRSELVQHCSTEHKIDLKRRVRQRYFYNCQKCEFIASSSAELKQHSLTIHQCKLKPKTKQIHPDGCKCKQCDNVAKTPRPNHQCELCNFTSNYALALEKHLKLHDRHYTCQHCDFKVHNEKDMVKHNETDHNSQSSNLNIIEDRESRRTPKFKFWYRCEPCNFSTIYESSFEKHFSFIHKTDITPEQINPEPEKIPNKKGRHRAWYDCEMCYNFSTDLKSDLASHMLKKHGKRSKSYVCEVCGSLFHCHNTFRMHKISKHSGVKCLCTYDGCGRSYANQGSLDKHIAIFHKHVKNYACKIEGCEKTFANTSQLKEHHVRIHLQERRFLCDNEGCDKSFFTKRHLMVHMRIHSNILPIQCELCNFQCRQRNSLNLHMKNYHSTTRRPPNKR